MPHLFESQLTFDHRRAVWIAAERALVLSDLHLGYAWAHRRHGQLMPVSAPDDAPQRLQELCGSYSPARIILLGDIVHRALPLEPIQRSLEDLKSCFGQTAEVSLIRGNHDRKLEPILAKMGLELVAELRLGRFRFVHGDEAASPERADEGVLTLMGHEHPAISLGDGISNRKFPCFLVSRNLVILPAFSNWAAGADVRSRNFMSPAARRASFTKALAILGDRILPVKL